MHGRPRQKAGPPDPERVKAAQKKVRLLDRSRLGQQDQPPTCFQPRCPKPASVHHRLEASSGLSPQLS